jgi:hypothetical protein
MAEQLLKRPDVIASFQEMRRKQAAGSCNRLLGSGESGSPGAWNQRHS